MRLIDEIKAQATFRVLDEKTETFYHYPQLPELQWPGIERSLIFCYLDNSFESISFLLRCFESSHVLALLPDGLSAELKSALESTYLPHIIFDQTREAVPGFYMQSTHCYFRHNRFKINLHPELRLLLSTSGTTGSPKMVKLSEKNLRANARSILGYLPVENTDFVPLNLPVHYSYGLSVLTSNAIGGATLCCSTENILSRQFWQNFQKYHYSTLAGVPYVYEMLDRIGFTAMELPSLRYFTQAGGKLRDALVRKYGEYAQQSKKRFYVMYGQTEATARMSYMPAEELLGHIGSIGRPVPGGRFEINPETGELIYYGDNIFGGYAENFNDLSAFASPEFLETGDLASIDGAGYYYITGRMKRFVKIYGNRVNLDELESALSTKYHYHLPCTGWKDQLILVFSTSADLPAQEIVAFLSKSYSIHPTSFKVVAVPVIPLTTNGKVDYIQLNKDYESR